MHKIVLDPGAYCTLLPTYCILDSLLAGNTIHTWLMPTLMPI